MQLIQLISPYSITVATVAAAFLSGCVSVVQVPYTEYRQSTDSLCALETFSDVEHSACQEACFAGDGLACDTLGNFLERGIVIRTEEGERTEPHLEESALYYQLACELEEPLGCFHLAELFKRLSTMEPPDMDAGELFHEAFELLEDACEGDDPGRCGQLAWFYENGEVVFRDEAQVRELYQRACDALNRDACQNLVSLVSESERVLLCGELCEGGWAVACQWLGRHHRSDTELSSLFYERACTLGNIDGCYSAARIYTCPTGGEFCDYTRAAVVYEDLCALGESVACVNLAELYFGALGVEHDLLRAVDLYQIGCDVELYEGCRGLEEANERVDEWTACEGGDRDVCNARAWWLMARDVEQALALWRLSCEANHGESCMTLGNRYADGWDVEQNDALAEHFYQLACDSGHALGCEEVTKRTLQILCDEEDWDACAELAIDYHRDYDTPEGVVLLERAEAGYSAACEGGDLQACVPLANLLLRARGGSDSEYRAFDLYRYACEAGHIDACTGLAHAYLGGWNGEWRDLTRGLDIAENACDSGSAEACVLIAESYRWGQFTETDLELARRYFEAGCDLLEASDSEEAVGWAAISCMGFGLALELGEGGTRSLRRAVPAYRAACDAGHGSACLHLAASAELGQEMEPDLELARQLYEQTCEEGHAVGCLGAELLSNLDGVAAFSDETTGAVEHVQMLTNIYSLGTRAQWGEEAIFIARLVELGDLVGYPEWEPEPPDEVRVVFFEILEALNVDLELCLSNEGNEPGDHRFIGHVYGDEDDYETGEVYVLAPGDWFDGARLVSLFEANDGFVERLRIHLQACCSDVVPWCGLP